MKHDFINDQIWHAAKQAALATGYYKIVPTNYLQAFINALPDPSYPEIALDDVRKGDRVRITTSMGNQYEVTVDRMDSYTWRWNGGSVYISAIESVHLIERPVNHPDPVEHPAIVVIEADEDTFTGPDILVWTGVDYENKDFGFSPDTITKWQPIDPAKVVADDD